MPAFFKPRRRRGPAGPNKNEAKVLRRAEAEREARSAGLLKDRFPSVQTVSINLKFITPQQDVWEERSLELTSSDVVDFAAPCPGRCGGERGSFDLSEEIKVAIEGRRERAEGRLICQETMNIGTAGTCDFRLEWKSRIAFAPE